MLNTLDDVMEAWEVAVERGENPSAVELCVECPELVHEVQRQIQALQTFASRFGLLVDPPEGSPEDSRTPSLPVRSVRISTVYQLEKLHAVGGLGSVYLAHDAELNRRVALKFPRGARHSAATRARFEREARITSQLDHPGIVPVHTIHSDSEGQPCYAMRFIEGQTLQEAIQNFHRDRSAEKYQTPAFRDLLRRFQSVCDIVAYSHSQGVIHRDIKPGNIMLGQYGETLLVDWGLARVLNSPDDVTDAKEPAQAGVEAENPSNTQPGHLIGTPAYASPEQLLCQLDQVDERSDVFSLGATLYCLLTGQHLIASTELSEHLRRIQRNQLSRPSALCPHVPNVLDAICHRALAVNPAERYASPLDMSRDIERYLADEPISIPCESWRVRGGRWLRKHPVVATSALVTISVGLIAAVVSSVLLQDKNRELSQSMAELDRTNRSLKRSYNDLGNSRVSKNVYQAKYERVLSTNAQALKALTALSSEASATFPRPSQIVFESDRPFIEVLRKRYQGFVGQHGGTTESLYIRAIGRLHAGGLSLSLDDLPLAKSQLAGANQDLLTLQAVSLVDQFDQCLAQCCVLQGDCERGSGNPQQAADYWRQAIVRFDKLLESSGSAVRPMHSARMQRAATLNRLAELSVGAPEAAPSQAEQWLTPLESSCQQLAELPVPEDQKPDAGLLRVQCLRVQALLYRTLQNPLAAQKSLDRALDLTRELLEVAPAHRQVRYLRGLCLHEQSQGLFGSEADHKEVAQLDQSLALASEAVQSLSLLAAEVPQHLPFRTSLSQALDARSQIQKAREQPALAAADLELSVLLRQPEPPVPEAVQTQLNTWTSELLWKRQAVLGDTPGQASSALEQWLTPLREPLANAQNRPHSVRLQIDALQMLSDLKVRLKQLPEAESLLTEAITAIDSQPQDRRSRLLFSGARAELLLKRAALRSQMGRLDAAEQDRTALRTSLDELDLGITESLMTSLERASEIAAPTVSQPANTSATINDPALTRAEVDRTRRSLHESLEVMRQHYIRAGLLQDAVVVWERQQRLTRDTWLAKFQTVTFPEPEQGLSPDLWVWQEPEITYIEIVGHIHGSVWGAGPYTDDSDLATAAVHSGLVEPGEVKVVGIRRLPGQPGYVSNTAHGVTTKEAAQFTAGYEIVGAGFRATTFYDKDYSYASKPHTVLVRGDANGFAYGTDLYSVDSELSAASVHAGLLKHQELSFLDVEILPGQDKYDGSTRNGVTTQDNGPWHATYRLTRPDRFRESIP